MGIDRARLRGEFDEAIDRLEAAVRDCPPEKWHDSVWPVRKTDPWIWPQPGVQPVPERTDESIQRFSAFWCVAYHALFFLDLYATPVGRPFVLPDDVQGGPEDLGFAADGAVAVPMETWPQPALVRYAAHGRAKVHETLATVTDEELAVPCPSDHPRAGETFGRVLQVNLDHVREHGGQLAAFLAQGS
jgi:hypothetical protein